jgi:predicted nucleic acid-binding protein
MKVLLDTNVITRLSQGSHPMHGTARRAIEQLSSSGRRLCIVPQNLYEFWAVATRPLRDNGLALSIGEAKVEMARLRKLFLLLPDSPNLLNVWEDLVVRHECKGKPTHDARLVAAMLTHQVGELLSFNTQDLSRFDEITLVDPASLPPDMVSHDPMP